MLRDWLVNDHIRRRLRRLRRERGLTTVEFARRLGLPRTSYVSLETGAYQIKLDYLHRALAILDADIRDVWPSPLQPEDVPASPSEMLRVQKFRLDEILEISQARGGLVLSKEGQSVKIHLTRNVSDTLIDRIIYYLEDDHLFRPGLWFGRQRNGIHFLLYLRAEEIPERLRILVRHYLLVWASYFEPLITSNCPDQSQLQTDQKE